MIHVTQLVQRRAGHLPAWAAIEISCPHGRRSIEAWNRPDQQTSDPAGR